MWMSGIAHEAGSTDRESQLDRIRRVIAQELTSTQREIILAYYFQDLSIQQIAAQRGIRVSSAYRTLHRAEANVRKYLQY